MHQARVYDYRNQEICPMIQVGERNLCVPMDNQVLPQLQFYEERFQQWVGYDDTHVITETPIHM